jgi:hypothetical protein
MKWISILALTCMLFAAAACGSDDEQSSTTTSTTATDKGKGTGGLPQGAEAVTLDPADFTTDIDNPYFPLQPGSRWVYREEDQRVVVTVTKQTKKVEGITARVVRDVVTQNGELVEDTFDWYAQDSAGNVWYMGEDTTEFENGEPKTKAGSWEAGVDGAEPGVIMPAKPRPGQAYRLEYYEGEAEDRASVVSVDETVTVPFGRFENVVKTRDVAPLSGGSLEFKYYAPDVGLVRTENSRGETGEQLVEFRRG